jgi:hypothetical protein
MRYRVAFWIGEIAGVAVTLALLEAFRAAIGR